MSRFLDELYFLMTEFHNFETEFKTQLSQNYISSNTACLVDAEEVENWKASVAYDESLEYLENNDKINFDKKQFELRKGTINRNKINFRSYKTLDEVCHSLKHNKRISIVGHQFFCYIDSMTYTPKVFEYYTKNNQLLIYFGEGKCLFIPDFSRYEEKKLTAEEIFIVDLPEDKKIFINCIFTYPNMSDSFQGKRNISLNMTNLLEYIINKNILNRKFKTYNYYFIDDENNKNIENININKYTINNINNINNLNNYNTTNVNKIITNINELNIDNINNKNLFNSADIYLNNLNMNNMNNLNNQNMNIYMYGNIQTDKPFIKNDNNNQIIIEKYHYIENPGNSNDMVVVNRSNNVIESGNNVTNEKSPDKDSNKDDFINKNNEYNTEYKNTYKEKEVEYGEILRQKQNQNLNKNINPNTDEFNIPNNKDININISGTNKDVSEPNNLNTIKREIINIKEANINKINYRTPNPDISVEDKKENNIPESNNIHVEIQNQKNKDEINNLNGQAPNEVEANNNNNINTTTTKIITHIKIETNVNNPNEETKNININISNNNNNQEFTFENYLKHPMIGLDNINGKSSYINSATQCLSHTVPLTNYFLNSKNKERILNNNASLINPSGPQLSPSYLHLLEKLWINTNEIKSVNPSEFVNSLKSLNSSFDKDAESEVGDLIIFILNQLDYELKQTIIEENNVEIKTKDKYLKKSYFYDSVQKNESIIYDTFFGGICETSKECLKCKEESDLNNNTDENKSFEFTKMNYLMFPIKDVYEFVQKNNEKDSINIYDCLNFFQNPIILDNENGKECEKCGKMSNYILVTKINKCQNNLLILLNSDMDKESYIKFNISEILSMSGYVQESIEKKVIYSLYAIICLSKNDKNEIHHVAFCNSCIDKMWYKYDDNNVVLINNLNNELSNYGIPTALFYQRENEEN